MKTKAEKKEKTERSKCGRSLKCVLTAAEVERAAEDLARRIADRDALEGDFKSVKSQFKDRIESAECDIAKNARLVREKSEFRSVDCEEIKDFGTKRVCLWRLDTGELLEDRTMRADELQGRLFPPEGEDAAPAPEEE